MADEALALDHALDCLREYEYDHISRSDYIRHKREHCANLLYNPLTQNHEPVPVPSKNLALELPGRAHSIPISSGRCR